MKLVQTRLLKRKIVYSLGPHNEFNEKEQWIRITEGCPHNCPYCYEPKEQKVFGIPEIVRTDVKIMDMNLLCKPEALNLLKKLKQKRVNGKVVYYEFVCGIDYRFLTIEIALALKQARIKKIRLAWDWFYKDQLKINDAIKCLLKVGYNSKQIMVFMICNWKIPFKECCKKLDLCKIWRVQIADCYFDNQTFPKVFPVHWTEEQLKTFRKKCRTHNQLVNFGIDPDIIKK